MSLYHLHILYLTVNENITSDEQGVARKLLAKVSAIREICSSCLLLNASESVAHDEVKVLVQTHELISIEIGVRSANTGYLNKLRRDKLFYARLASFITSMQQIPDRIIFRYPFASAGLAGFCRSFHKKVVFEHNSKETEEQKLNVRNKRYASFSLIPSRFFYWYQEKVYPIYKEAFGFRQVTGHALAGACVTTEISAYEHRRNRRYRTFVSSNFYDVASAPVSSSHFAPGDQLRLGMIVTSTAPWYGLDRLLRSFSPVQGRYRLVIAGLDKTDATLQQMMSKYGVTDNVELMGRLGRQKLGSFYDSVHVCFGSLGLHTIGLQSASTLKVKESLAYGVPVAIGYTEEDFLVHREFAPYYLQLENNSSPIDFPAVEAFAGRFYADPHNRASLKQLALQHLDSHVKMKALIKNILAS